jgi:hypothetical protein
MSTSRDTCKHESACVDAIYSIPKMAQKEGISRLIFIVVLRIDHMTPERQNIY